MKKYFFTILVSLLVVLIYNPVKAQSIEPKITISPAVFEFEVVAGEILSRQIKVTNNSAVSLPVKVKAVNFDARDETGGIKFISDVDELELAAYKWLEIEPADFILEPQETEVVDVNISIPIEAVPGGHYATILFEPQLPSFYFSKEATKIVPVVGTLMLFNVQRLDLVGLVTDNPVTIEQFIMPDEGRIRAEALVKGINRLLAYFKIPKALAAKDLVVYESIPREIMLRMRNNDIFHIRPVGKVEVYNLFNRQVASGDLTPTTILPQRVRQIPLILAWRGDNGLIPGFFGRYNLVLKADVNGKQINESVDFWVIPWKFILSTVVIFGIFTYFVLKYRRRLLIALKVLINK